MVVAGCVLYTLAQLHPDLILKNTTPAGGDMGAHVWGPAYLRDHILPHFWLSGWSPDWYAGFPMYLFYMVPPALAVVVLDVVLPYGVALKLVSVARHLVACRSAPGPSASCAGLRFPVPPLFADRRRLLPVRRDASRSTAATSPRRWRASSPSRSPCRWRCSSSASSPTGCAPASTAPWPPASSPSPRCATCIVMFFAAIGAVVLFLLWADKKRLWYATCVGVVGGLLCAFWYIPFWRDSKYMTDMFYERLDATTGRCSSRSPRRGAG